MNFIERPQWRTVTGGSRQYVEKLTAHLGDAVRTNTNILRLERKSGAGRPEYRGQGEVYCDKVVMAAHADASLAMIKDASQQEREILGKV